MKFVTSTVTDWYSEYSYSKDVQGLEYGTQSAKFIKALKVYNSFYNRFITEKSKPENSKKTTDALRMFKNAE